MNYLIATLLIFTSLNSMANIPTMSKQCEKIIAKEIGPEGSVQSSTKDIIKELKLDWKNNPDKDVAHYDDCGPSDFFYITVKKETCEIIEIGSGDSDGECN